MVNSKKDSYIGQIPADWVERSWGEVLQGFKTGITPSRKVSDYFNGKNQWFTSGELKKHYIYNSIEKISKEVFEQENLSEITDEAIDACVKRSIELENL